MTTTPKPTPASDEEIVAFTGDVAIYRREHDGKLHCTRCYAESAGHRPGCDHAMWPSIKARIDADRARIREQAEEIERLRRIIAAVSCNEATITDCERYCSHGEDKLHAEARAIRAATTYAEPEPGR